MAGLRVLRAAFVAAVMAGGGIGGMFGGGAAEAATLDLATLGYTLGPVVASTNLGSVTVGGDPATPGVLELFATEPAFELFIDSLDVADALQASFSVFGPDFGTDALSGTGAAATGTDETTGLLQFLFTGVLGTGAYAPFDGGAVLVEILIAGLLPFADGFIADGTATLTYTILRDSSPAVIPLPAGLPLLLAGLGALAVVRRSRHSARG
jgi:hypothetical protein